MNPYLSKTLLVPLLLSGVLSLTPLVPASAQQYGGTAQVSEQDLDAFDAFLESHTATARLLSRNPDLINDRRFVRQHPALQEWLDNHPRIARKIENDPDAFLQRDTAEGQLGASGSASTRVSVRDVSSFEAYLNSDWETAQLLYRNPDLISDRQFVRSHPDLQDWLEDHPDAAAAIQANPHKFLWRERTVGAQDFLNQLLGRR